MPPSVGDLTLLLRAWSAGEDRAHQELWPLVYDEVKRLARTIRYGKPYDPHTTTIVHEAYLRLCQGALEPEDRAHFFALAAQAMRYVLVDEARRRTAAKRGGGAKAVTLEDDWTDEDQAGAEELLAIDQVLDRLREREKRQAEVVELRYFAGLSVPETADALNISAATVKREWQAARKWLYSALQSA